VRTALLRGADLDPGRTFQLGTYEVTEAEIIAFATAWDPLPFHVDRVAAERGRFGGLIASGAHTIAIMVRLGSDGVMAKLDLIVGSAIRDLEFSKPVRPGDVLSGHASVVERETHHDGNTQVWIRFNLIDQNGEQVLSLVGGVVVHR
jgi:acyl dehydratase